MWLYTSKVQQTLHALKPNGLKFDVFHPGLWSIERPFNTDGLTEHGKYKDPMGFDIATRMQRNWEWVEACVLTTTCSDHFVACLETLIVRYAVDDGTQ